MKKDEDSRYCINYLDEIKRIIFNVFLFLGVITVFLYIYKRTNPYSFIGLEERFLAMTLLFGFLSIISHINEISIPVSALKNKMNSTTKFCSFIPKKNIFSTITRTEICYAFYFILIIVVSFLIILFSSKFLLQLRDLVPYFILIYFFISLILKLDSRIPIAFALLLLFLTAVTLVQGLENAANQIAIYAYYLLVVGVVLQLIEYIRNPQEED